jgi:hypothetical protein
VPVCQPYCMHHLPGLWFCFSSLINLIRSSPFLLVLNVVDVVKECDKNNFLFLICLLFIWWQGVLIKCLHSILWALVRMEIINKMWRVGLLSDLTITLLSSYHLLHEERFRCKQIDLRAVCWVLQIHPLLVWLFNFIPKYMRSYLQNISSGLGQSYELRKRAPWIGFIIRTIHQSRNSQSRFVVISHDLTREYKIFFFKKILYSFFISTEFLYTLFCFIKIIL